MLRKVTLMGRRMVMLQRWLQMEGEWSCNRVVAVSMEGEWSCYRGGSV